MADVVEYDREAITKALTVLAFCNGNAKAAIRKLKDAEWACPTEQTLRHWSRRHADIYEDAKTRHAELFVPEADELVRDSITFQQVATKRLLENVDDMDLKDLSTAARNSAVIGGLAFDKSQIAKGQPTSIVQVQDAAKILEELNELARIANAGAVDSTAEEIDDVLPE
jgi:hypothetical protein